ncbi:unnamed protein product [Caenorhabditis angaria]|uniref:PAN-3 domain-containing protein n=1 Tax=Caenorhabditis angaria TaxID=860376 RepID=A0A9P1IGJ7_9PELO|nr:unnamed protein product [Caenorhabditis angaria]
MLAKLLILLTIQSLTIASKMIIVWGSYDTSITDVLYTAEKETIQSDEECWKLFELKTEYEIAFWSDGTCYLNTYPYVAWVGTDDEKTNKIAFKITTDLTKCPDMFKSAKSQNHKISYDEGYWYIESKVDCGELYWTTRGAKTLCYTYWGDRELFTYSSALSVAKDSNEIFSSPMNIKETIDMYYTDAKRNKYLKSRIITDAKRSDSCNTEEKISKPECQYPKGFDFKDSTNPRVSLYEFVENPTISTKNRCVAMLIDLKNSAVNGKFNFVQCEQTCENGYCSHYFVTIKFL